MSGSFGDTLDALHHFNGDESLFAEVIARPFPVSGASVTLGGAIPGSTVSVTGRLAARFDELQLDLGEGPLCDALRTMRPVIEPDLVRGAPSRWPSFLGSTADLPLGAVFAFPLLFGQFIVGTITLYADDPVELFPDEIAQLEMLADVTARLLMHLSLERAAAGSEIVPERFSRRTIHQAVGMVTVQSGVSPKDAELLIGGHAFAMKMSMHDVAVEILQRRLVFDPITMWRKD